MKHRDIFSRLRGRRFGRLLRDAIDSRYQDRYGIDLKEFIAEVEAELAVLRDQLDKVTDRRDARITLESLVRIAASARLCARGNDLA